MKKTVACCLLILSSSSAYAQLGIGTKQPDSSAILEMSSTKQGFLPPRMTTAERDAINGGKFAEGLVIYNIDDKCLQHWNGVDWKCSGTSGNNKNLSPSFLSCDGLKNVKHMGELQAIPFSHLLAENGLVYNLSGGFNTLNTDPQHYDPSLIVQSDIPQPSHNITETLPDIK